MNVDLRIKMDPRADGRVAEPGDLIEFWVRWSCPGDGPYTVKVTSVVEGEQDGTEATECPAWHDVVVLGEMRGVLLPAAPSCPGY